MKEGGEQAKGATRKGPGIKCGESPCADFAPAVIGPARMLATRSSGPVQ